MQPLNDLNTLELLEKISEFKKIDLQTATVEEITLQSLKTLKCMLVSSCCFAEKSKLYRIRKLNNDLSNIPRVFQDVWHPTPEMVKNDGRVNFKGQPVLYCSTDQITPLYECDIKENDCYAIIQYSVKDGENLIGYTVGSQEEPNDLNETGKINNRIINDFVISEFSKPVGVGTEYLYKISNVICRNYMDMPFCDAYVYPSIARYKQGWNVAIKPESAFKKIKFDVVLICTFKGFSESGDYLFDLKHKANALDKNNKLIYVF